MHSLSINSVVNDFQETGQYFVLLFFKVKISFLCKLSGLKAVDTIGNYNVLKMIISTKPYLVTSNGERLDTTPSELK